MYQNKAKKVDTDGSMGMLIPKYNARNSDPENVNGYSNNLVRGTKRRHDAAGTVCCSPVMTSSSSFASMWTIAAIDV